MNKSDKQEILAMIVSLIGKDSEAKVSDLVNTAPIKAISDIASILKAMTATALKKQFGLNTLEYKFQGIKAFMTLHNIQSGTKYPPTLNYEMKHMVNDIIIKSMNAKPQKQALINIKKTLQAKIDNPPKMLYGKAPSEKQITHIEENIRRELERWQ